MPIEGTGAMGTKLPAPSPIKKLIKAVQGIFKKGAIGE